MFTHLQQRGVPLSQTHVILQHDNTCREFKNHSGLRFCASQISSKNLMGVTCSFLRTGHTHEDIDQMFSRMSKHLQRVPVLQTPDDVCNTINDFLQQAHMPHEKDRRVIRRIQCETVDLGTALNFFIYLLLPRSTPIVFCLTARAKSSGICQTEIFH